MHTVVSPLVLVGLVFVLSVELVLHLGVEVFKLLVIPQLVCLQALIDFLALINCVLLDVFNLSIGSREADKSALQNQSR